jgi:hypothetical protein
VNMQNQSIRLDLCVAGLWNTSSSTACAQENNDPYVT